MYHPLSLPQFTITTVWGTEAASMSILVSHKAAQTSSSEVDHYKKGRLGLSGQNILSFIPLPLK